MAAPPLDSVDESPKWLKGPDSNSYPVAPPQPVEAKQEQSESAMRAARKVLDQADKLISAGQLRKAFVECQSVLIDYSHNLPDELSAKLHHMMARISLSQGKRQRAEKYLKRAMSLDPSLPRMDQLVSHKTPPGENQSGENQQPPVVAASMPAVRSISKPGQEPGTEPGLVTGSRSASSEQPVEPQPDVAATPLEQSSNGRLAWVASFYSRALAFAIDALLVLVLISFMVALSSQVLGFSKEDLANTMAGSLSNVVVLFMLFVLFLLTYSTVFARFGGQTLGKIVFGLRVVRLDGHSLTTTDALLRALGMLLSALPGLGGFVWAAFDLQKRGWHDRVGKTLVVKIKPPKIEHQQSAKESIGALEQS